MAEARSNYEWHSERRHQLLRALAEQVQESRRHNSESYSSAPQDVTAETGKDQGLPSRPGSSGDVQAGFAPEPQGSDAGGRHAKRRAKPGRTQPMSVAEEIMSPAEERWVDSDGMAEILGWSRSHLDRVRHTPGFPILRIGRKVQYKPRLVLEFLEKCAAEGRVLDSQPQRKRGKK